MAERFAWVPDPARGEWLRTLEDGPFGNVLSVVTRGFEAYARVFHPVERDRPRTTRTWRGIDEDEYFRCVDDIETERATWADAAASFATVMHAEARYARLVRSDDRDLDEQIAADGWRYLHPEEGCLDLASLSTASAVLARHTATPDAGVAAIWEGWGGLVSSAGVSHIYFEPNDGSALDHLGGTTAHNDGPSLLERVAAVARPAIAGTRSIINALPGHTPEDPEPGSGLLTREVAAGQRLDLHGDSGRHYVLFEAGATWFRRYRLAHRRPLGRGKLVGAVAQHPVARGPRVGARHRNRLRLDARCRHHGAHRRTHGDTGS